MTLAAANPIVSYVGNNSTFIFPFPFPTYTQADLFVVVVGASQSYVLTLGTDYTVADLNLTGTPASVEGAIELVDHSQAWLSDGNLASGYSLIIQRIVSLAQLTSLRNQGDFYPETIEDALDYEMMAIQQIQAGAYVIADLLNGHTYRLVMINGVLSQIQVT